MRRLNYRCQRTIGRPADIQGLGFLTGAMVRLRFLPAPPDCGVVFVRGDLTPRTFIPARIDQVTGTQRRTTLGKPPAQVGLVEHVLAALAGLRIDNCFVELNAPEPPGLDGSAIGFVEILMDAKITMQSARQPIWHVKESVVLSQGGATLAYHPWDEDALKISYLLDYGWQSPIPHQMHTQVITPELFYSELAACRTFILESEADELRRQGLGARTTAADLLVFDHSGKVIDGPPQDSRHYRRPSSPWAGSSGPCCRLQIRTPAQCGVGAVPERSARLWMLGSAHGSLIKDKGLAKALTQMRKERQGRAQRIPVARRNQHRLYEILVGGRT